MGWKKSAAFCLGWALAICLIDSIDAGEAGPRPITIEGAACRAGSAVVYRDEKASEGKCAVLILGRNLSADSAEKIVEKRISLPMGDYEMAAWVQVYPVSLLHDLAIVVQAGDATRNYGAAQIDPAPGYQRHLIRFFHPGGPITLGVFGRGHTGFDGVRKDNSEDEKAESTKGVGQSSTLQLPGKANNEEAQSMELEEEPSVSKLTLLDQRIIVDKLEVRALRTPPAAVARVDVDKVHYLPGETVKVSAKVLGGAAGGPYQLVADLITEYDTTRRVFAQDIALASASPGKPTPVDFEFKLDGVTEFGHEIRLSLIKEGQAVHSNSAYFGVSANVYRVGITGQGGGQDKQHLTLEQSAAIQQRNKDVYANYFECFAWAPSDYSCMVPPVEKFWSGQTQYPGSITGLRNFIAEGHKRGVKAFTYGSIMADGIYGYQALQRHPECIDVGPGGQGGMLSTFFLERGYHNEYTFNRNGPCSHDWSNASDLWANGSSESIDLSVDQISRSIDLFGWDGVRWDFWFVDQMATFKARMKKIKPDVIYGYNTAMSNPGSPDRVFLPNAGGPESDFLELNKDHGMIMDENNRNWSHTNFSPGTQRPFYEALCREGNYEKRAGGLPLFITFDIASRLDTTYCCLCGLVAGERYTYLTSPGDFDFGPLPKFLTRFSAFVWDDTAMIADGRNVVKVDVEKGPRDVLPWYDQSVWLRKLPDGRQQLLVNLLNPTGYVAFCNRVQIPPSTLLGVGVSVPTPAGAKLLRTFHVLPDLQEGVEPLTPTESADGRARVVASRVRTWSIVVFEYGPATGTLAYPAFKLTTPLEDARALMKAQDQRKLKETQAANEARKIGLVNPDGTPATPPTAGATGAYFSDFARTFNADEPIAGKLTLLHDMSIRRDGVLDVHHAKGAFSWLNPVELAIGLAGGGNYNCSYIYAESYKDPGDGFMEGFLDTFPDLLKQDVLILDNVNARVLGPRRRAMIAQYVKNGGGLLIIGGFGNLSMGADRNSALADLLPVQIVKYNNLVKDKEGMALAPAAGTAGKTSFFPDSIDWSANPVAFTVDASPLKPEVQVLATAGGHPAIVASTYGKGRVVTLLVNVHGDYSSDKSPYWLWSGYPKLIASCIKWLGEDAGKTYVPTPEPVKLDPNEVAPDNLMVEAALLEPAELTKRLKSAQKNMIDAATSRMVLETAVQCADKVDDQELLGVIAETAGQYVDASFSPVGKKLVKSQYMPLRCVGYQVIGLAGDKAFRDQLDPGLDEKEIPNQRAALVAMGRLGDPGSIPAIRKYLANNGTQTLLALSVLRRLGDTQGLALALPAYNASLRDHMSTKCFRISTWTELTGGISFGLTPARRKKLTFDYLMAVKHENACDFDNRFFVDSVKDLNDADVATLLAFFKTADSYRVTQLAYAMMSRMSPKLLAQYKAGLADAALPELRELSKQ